jgi:hypothetical protein
MSLAIQAVLNNEDDERFDEFYKGIVIFPRAKAVHCFYNLRIHHRHYEDELVCDEDIQIRLFYNRGTKVKVKVETPM